MTESWRVGPGPARRSLLSIWMSRAPCESRQLRLLATIFACRISLLIGYMTCQLCLGRQITWIPECKTSSSLSVRLRAPLPPAHSLGHGPGTASTLPRCCCAPYFALNSRCCHLQQLLLLLLLLLLLVHLVGRCCCSIQARFSFVCLFVGFVVC